MNGTVHNEVKEKIGILKYRQTKRSSKNLIYYFFKQTKISSKYS